MKRKQNLAWESQGRDLIALRGSGDNTDTQTPLLGEKISRGQRTAQRGVKKALSPHWMEDEYL